MKILYYNEVMAFSDFNTAYRLSTVDFLFSADKRGAFPSMCEPTESRTAADAINCSHGKLRLLLPRTLCFNCELIGRLRYLQRSGRYQILNIPVLKVKCLIQNSSAFLFAENVS